jgi:hypothetical protein
MTEKEELINENLFFGLTLKPFDIENTRVKKSFLFSYIFVISLAAFQFGNKSQKYLS